MTTVDNIRNAANHRELDLIMKSRRTAWARTPPTDQESFLLRQQEIAETEEAYRSKVKEWGET